MLLIACTVPPKSPFVSTEVLEVALAPPLFVVQNQKAVPQASVELNDMIRSSYNALCASRIIFLHVGSVATNSGSLHSVLEAPVMNLDASI